MPSGEEIGFIVAVTVLIGAVIFYGYISFKTKKNRRIYIQECNDLYRQLLCEHKSLKTTNSHAEKHAYYEKMGYYPNLAGTYKKHKIFVQHATRKGMLPNRTWFFMVHDKNMPDELRLYHKKNSMIVSRLQGGKKLELKGPSLTPYIANISSNSNFDEDLIMSIIRRIDKLIIVGNPFYFLSIDSFGIEVNYFGYVNERSYFNGILDTIVEIIDDLARRYPTIDYEETEILKKLPLSDSKYNEMVLAPKKGRIIAKKADKSFEFTQDDLLLLFEVGNQIKLYFENWREITLPIENKDKIEKLRAWMYLQN